MPLEVRRVSHGPKHHLFGFHDLVQSNAKGDFLLSLEVDDISHPPLPGEMCCSGVLEDGEFRFIHKTHTWNYPQGARQQWIGESDNFVCNDRDNDGGLISWVSDARAGKTIDKLPFPIHCLDAKTGKAYYFNYDRIQGCGAYGYIPGKDTGMCRIVDLPEDDGIFVGDIRTGKHSLLVSVKDVAACGERTPVRTGFPHYVTHAMLNPSGTRLCFLHRYRVVDGGDVTRLMSIGADGRELRCLAKGALSHFTWIDDERIFIWGEDQRGLCAMREMPYLRIPGVYQLAMCAKGVLRFVRARRGTGQKVRQGIQAHGPSFLLVRDSTTSEILRTGLGVLTTDGHPMACPNNLKHLVNDTYPNKDGVRMLMWYDIEDGRRTNIGEFKMLDEKPDRRKFDWKAVMAGVDGRVMKKFDIVQFLFCRSGLHCDLHPRWSADGKVAYFDSIHEGSRQIYAVQG